MRAILLTLSLVTTAAALLAQDATFDPTYNPTDEGMARFDGLHWAMRPTGFPGEGVRTMTVQADGKLLIGGWFAGGTLGIEDPVLRPGIARLNTDGSQDLTFNAGAGFDGPIEVIVVQTDGKILVGGAFLNCQGQPRKGIARLNANGSLDATFNVGTGTGGTVFEIAVQGDGRILLGGNFTTFNGIDANRIVRVLSNGTYDASFTTGTGFDATVRAIGVQVDGQVLVGGEFTSYDGYARNKAARLGGTGVLDLSYTLPIIGTVTDIAIGTGGSAFVAAVFGVPSLGAVKKFTGSGMLDPAFSGSAYAEHVFYDQSTNVVTATAVLNNPALMKLNGTTGAEVCRSAPLPRTTCNFLPQDWLISTVGPNGEVYRIDPAHLGILRYNSACAFDPSFNVGKGLGWMNSATTSLTMDEVGRASIGGRIDYNTTLPALNGTYAPDLSRLTYDGEPDATFLFDHGIEGSVNKVYSLGSDRYLFQGSITLFCGSGGTYVVTTLLMYDASSDVFTPLNAPGAGTVSSDYGPEIQRVLPLGSGKLLYVGQDTYSGASRDIGRFNSDGTWDGVYVTTDLGPLNELPYCAEEAGDGKVYVAGAFTTANGLTRNRIARLLPNGGVDPSFDPLGGFDDRVRDMIVNPDGTIVCIGDFSNYRGASAPHIAKLLPNASMDPSFDPGSGIANAPLCMLRYPDGRLLIGGAIPAYNGTPVNGIMCINTDGSIDGTFAQGEGFRINNPTINGGTYGGGTVVDMKMQPNGQVVCMGEFHMYDGHGRNRLARIGSGESLMLSARVMLEGAYNGSATMSALFGPNLIPLKEPYRALGFTHVRGGSESTSPAVLLQQGGSAIVDWIMVELRDAQNPAQIVATRSGLLRADGWIVDTDGSSPLRFFGTGMGSYYVAIRHRNHLGIMSQFPFFLGSAPFPIDLTGPNYPTYGTNAQKEVNGVRMLWAGDVNHDGQLKYTGQSNDRDPILVTVGGTTPNTITTGYKPEDINMDGVVKYTGADNDRDPILVNIGGTTPNNVRQAQLP